MNEKTAYEQMLRLAKEMEAGRHIPDPATAKWAASLTDSSLMRLERDLASAARSGALDHLKFSAVTPDASVVARYAEVARSYDGIGKTLAAIDEATRVGKWASTLSRVELPALSKFFSETPAAFLGIASINKLLANSALHSKLKSHAGLVLGAEGLGATHLKISAIAGITDVLGYTPAWDQAYSSLLGTWQTRLSLPEEFWAEPGVRRRMYDEAQVDSGLVDADIETTINVTVESGLARGERSGGVLVAVFDFADVSMTVSSRGTRDEAFRLIGGFEESLRSFIEERLRSLFGDDWFKLRVDGNLFAKAKAKRFAARQRDEAHQPLIKFTELGELGQIICATNNWNEAFRDVFVNKDSFRHDMEKLIAGRHPTMHTRSIDSVRLVEMICVIRRLQRQIEGGGAWMLECEEDS